MTEWNGRPELHGEGFGWHWLVRRRDGKSCMAFWSRATGWRIADSIGRTTLRSEFFVSKHYDYSRRVV